MPGVEDAIALLAKGDVKSAHAILLVALDESPENGRIHHFLGLALEALGDQVAAYRHLETAIALEPHNPILHGNFGLIALENGHLDVAQARLEASNLLEPDNPTWLSGLGVAQLLAGLPGTATSSLRSALRFAPNEPTVTANLIRALCACGHADKAFAEGKNAPDLVLRHPAVRQAMIWAALYSDVPTSEETAQLILDAGRSYPKDRSSVLFRNNRHPDRRLRIALVSGDFRNHAVMRFVSPLLDYLDPEEAELVLYATTPHRDGVTEWAEGKVKALRNVSRMDQATFLQTVESDKIDVIVDLAGHSQGNRLWDLAARVAPVQISWLGFPASTGIPSINVRFVDVHSDPPGAEKWCSERLHRLPEGFHCFRPAASPKLVRQAGPVTFGSLNTVAKVSETTLRLWVKCLQAVPGSRMILKAASFSDPVVVTMIRDRFRFWGIPDSQLEIMEYLPDENDHLECYNLVDVALDTFPYHGTTTTCEALWMGVPVVTLAGEMHHSRVGISLLNHVGHPEWVAKTEEDYVEIATRLARPRSPDARESLRRDLLNSPLMDEPRFAQKWMAAVRGEWQTWAKRKA